MSRSNVAKRIFTSIALLIVTACAPVVPGTKSDASSDRSGHVSGTLIEPPSPDRYKILSGVRYDQPAAFLDNSQPAYPSGLLAQHVPPATVRIRLVVNEDGRVTQVRPLEPLKSSQQAYYSAIESAVLKWRFFPLVKVSDGPGHSTVTVDDVTTTYDGTAVRLPFHQDYSFSFEQIDGKGVVKAH